MTEPAGTATPVRPEVRVPGFLTTRRRDRWWVAPLLIATGFVVLGLYAFWAALQNAHYEWGPYLSPFYSPLITPKGWPLSPAFLILWAPLGFRATCYYYRKAYYRSLFASPPGCAVGSVTGASYKGEHEGLFIRDEPPPVLPLSRARLHPDPLDRRGPGLPLARGRRRSRVRDRLRDARDPRQHDPALGVHVRLQLAAPPRRRRCRLLLLPARRRQVQGLALRHVLQRAPHALGLVLALLRGLRGPLRPALVDGRDLRSLDRIV